MFAEHGEQDLSGGAAGEADQYGVVALVLARLWALQAWVDPENGRRKATGDLFGVASPLRICPWLRAYPGTHQIRGGRGVANDCAMRDQKVDHHRQDVSSGGASEGCRSVARLPENLPDLVEHWTLLPAETDELAGKHDGPTKLGVRQLLAMGVHGVETGEIA